MDRATLAPIIGPKYPKHLDADSPQTPVSLIPGYLPAVNADRERDTHLHQPTAALGVGDSERGKGERAE
jgi:hypothetical protein